MKIFKNPSSYVSLFVILLWIVFVLIGFWYYFSNDIYLESLIFGMQEYIRANLLVGIWFFLLIYVVRPLLFIPAAPFDLFSGMVFGPLLWFFVSSLSTLLSTMFSYWVWFLTWGLILEKKNFKKLEKLKNKLSQHTFQTTFMMRIIMLPFDLSNYICGVLQAPYIRYVTGTWLWVLPATAIFVWAGAAFYGKNITSYDTLLQNVNYIYLILSSVFFVTIIIISKIVKEKYRDISI